MYCQVNPVLLFLKKISRKEEMIHSISKLRANQDISTYRIIPIEYL